MNLRQNFILCEEYSSSPNLKCFSGAGTSLWTLGLYLEFFSFLLASTSLRVSVAGSFLAPTFVSSLLTTQAASRWILMQRCAVHSTGVSCRQCRQTYEVGLECLGSATGLAYWLHGVCCDAPHPSFSSFCCWDHWASLATAWSHPYRSCWSHTATGSPAASQ